MNINAFSSATWGIQDAAARFNGAAQNIAVGAGDLATNLVEGTMLAPAQLELNAQVVRIADDAHKSLIDVLA
jgi:hypothetical protein